MSDLKELSFYRDIFERDQRNPKRGLRLSQENDRTGMNSLNLFVFSFSVNLPKGNNDNIQSEWMHSKIVRAFLCRF